MKKLLVLAFILLFTKAYSNDNPGNYISAGFGFPNIPRLVFNNLNFFDSKSDYKNTGTGPLHFKYENRVTSFLGIGVNINYMDYRVSYTEPQLDTFQGVVVMNKVKISAWNLATNVRANFYFTNPENTPKTDVYFGIGLGYRMGKFTTSADIKGTEPKIQLPSLFKLGCEATFGYRHYFNDHIGLYAELGLAKSILQVGLTGRI